MTHTNSAPQLALLKIYLRALCQAAFPGTGTQRLISHKKMKTKTVNNKNHTEGTRIL